MSLSKSWNEKAFALPSFLWKTSGIFPCANYKVTFLAAPEKWVPLSQSLCLTALLYLPKNQKPLFLMLGPSLGSPNFKVHWIGPQVGSLCPLSEAMGRVGVSENQLLPLSCLSPDPLCPFLSNQTGRHQSRMYALSGRWKNINVSLSSCLEVEPFREMSPHQAEMFFLTA